MNYTYVANKLVMYVDPSGYDKNGVNTPSFDEIFIQQAIDAGWIKDKYSANLTIECINKTGFNYSEIVDYATQKGFFDDSFHYFLLQYNLQVGGDTWKEMNMAYGAQQNAQSRVAFTYVGMSNIPNIMGLNNCNPVDKSQMSSEEEILWLKKNPVEVGRSLTKREELLDIVENQKLRNAVDQIYRPGATTGDGGLADAIRHQLSTGELVGGKDHLNKGIERVRNLTNIINKENLNSTDLKITEKLLTDLINALGGR